VSDFESAMKGKAVLVTGAGRGIGKRLAIGFAAAGASVAMVARSRAELDLAQLEIEHSGGTSARFAGDVRDREFLAEAANRASVQFHRPIDVLICAAGVQGPIGGMLEADAQAWWEAVEINLGGVVNACRAVLCGMQTAQSGKIIALTGGGVASARPYFTAYAAAKAAVARYIESLALELTGRNIQANCMSPGGTYTAMTDEILRAGERAGQMDLDRARQVRLTGGVPPERQLALAMFLASPRSNHISGRLLHVNDDWERIAQSNLTADAYTLRRFQK
jgi:3-oxoacyl-[acyl-carrier protein] reductase